MMFELRSCAIEPDDFPTKPHTKPCALRDPKGSDLQAPGRWSARIEGTAGSFTEKKRRKCVYRNM